jgi:hypothetical protein
MPLPAGPVEEASGGKLSAQSANRKAVVENMQQPLESIVQYALPLTQDFSEV